MDFEDQMDLFFVRKENVKLLSESADACNKKINYSKEFKCIPLMCKHVISLNENWKDKNVIQIFSDVLFTHCMVYGKIMSREKEYKSSNRYMLDDGTASLYINVFRKREDMDVICKMENELQAVRKDMLAQNKNEIVNSLRNLLFKAKEQIGNSDLCIGSKILVYGKPTCRRGEIILNAHCFIEDGKSNRDLEICFKDYLIYWYRNYIFLTKS